MTSEQAVAEAEAATIGVVPGNATAAGGAASKDGKTTGKDSKGDKKGGRGSAGRGSAGKGGKKGGKKTDEPVVESKSRPLINIVIHLIMLLNDRISNRTK